MMLLRMSMTSGKKGGGVGGAVGGGVAELTTATHKKGKDQISE